MATNEKYLHSDITNSILQAFYTIVKKFPFGLDLDVYKRALAVELEFLGLSVEQDLEVKIHHRQKKVGSFTIDLVVDNSVIVRIIRDEDMGEGNVIEVKNQLRFSEYEVCLILNFVLEGQHRRLVYTNDIKQKD